MMNTTTNFLIEVYQYVAKAKETLVAGALVVGLSLLLSVSSCGGDQLDIPDQPLQGSINGDEWSSEIANAYRLQGSFQYRVRFLSELEPVSDPCALPFPGLAHVKAIFSLSMGDFSVAPLAIDDNQVQVAFEIGATSLLATSGSMSIFDINNGIVVGFLQASFNDDNSVEGIFRINICD